MQNNGINVNAILPLIQKDTKIGNCQPNALQNTQRTILWVKDLSVVPEDNKDLLRSEYTMHKISLVLNSAQILSDQHLLCGADKGLHRHLG